MAVYTISDLHLSTNTDKSMEIFGQRWQNYMDRIRNNWNKLIEPEDTVILPGDISWSLTLKEAIPDLLYIQSLNGKKIIGKGNHDLWWQTVTKIKKAFNENGIDSIELLHNNAIIAENFIICGTRGWYDDDKGIAVNNTDNEKIINREVLRLRMSLDSSEKLEGGNKEKIVFLHFPPVWGDQIYQCFVDVLHEYDIKRCYFGHIHGCKPNTGSFVYEGISFYLVSSDYLSFTPFPVYF